ARDALEAQRLGLDAECPLVGAHAFTEPSPGTNGGLWWKGTPLRQSFRACQWISVVTRWGISGERTRAAARLRFVSSRRRPCRTAVSGREPFSRTWMRAKTSSPGSEKRYS